MSVESPVHPAAIEPFVQRVINDRAVSPRNGREEGRRLHTDIVRMKRAEPERQFPEELVGPRYRFKDIESESAQLTGWKSQEDATFVFGTSYCRADISEQGKMLGMLEALKRSGQEQHSYLYFIDPYAHTVHELLTDMEHDLHLQEGYLHHSLDVKPRQDIPQPNVQQAAGLQLPPYYYDMPSHDAIHRLAISSPVKQALHQAREESSRGHFGDMRVELDRRLIGQYLQKLGYSPDLIKVKSFEDILESSEAIPMEKLADRAKAAWSKYRTELYGKNDNAAQRAPVVFRLVHGNERLYVDGNFNFSGGDENTDRHHVDTQETRAMAAAMKNMTLQEYVRAFPGHLGGIGYALTCAELAEAEKRGGDYAETDTIGAFHVDDYEKGKNMGLIAMDIMRGGALTSFWVPRVMVGRQLPGGRAEYATPPDMLQVLERPEKSFVVERAAIDLLATMTREDDVKTQVGIMYKADGRQMHGPVYIPNSAQFAEMVNGNGHKPENTLNITIPAMEVAEGRKFVAGLSYFDPEKLNHIIFGEKTADGHPTFGSAKELSRRVRILEYVFDSMNARPYLGDLGSKLEDNLRSANQAISKGELYAEDVRNVLTDEDWVTYWRNRLQIYQKAAAELNIDMSNVPIRNDTTSVEAIQNDSNDYSKYFQEKYEHILLRQALTEARSPEVALYAGLVQGLDDHKKLLSNLQILRALSKPGMQLDEVKARRRQEVIEQSGLDSSISAPQIEVMMGELRERLMAESAEIFESVDNIVVLDVQDAHITNKLKALGAHGHIEPGTVLPPFDNNGRITKEFSARIEYTKHAVGLLTRMHEIKQLYDLGIRLPGQEEKLQQVQDLLAMPKRQVDGPMYATIHELSEAMVKEYKATVIKPQVEALKNQIKQAWELQNMTSPHLKDALAKKKVIDDAVYQEVTQVLKIVGLEITGLKDEFLSEYTQWRESAIAAMASQGFELPDYNDQN